MVRNRTSGADPGGTQSPITSLSSLIHPCQMDQGKGDWESNVKTAQVSDQACSGCPFIKVF